MLLHSHDNTFARGRQGLYCFAHIMTYMECMPCCFMHGYRRARYAGAIFRLMTNPDCQKTPESSAGLAALWTLIAPSDMCGGRGDIFTQGNLISRSKNIFLAVSTPGNPQDFSGNCVGVAVAGRFSPVHACQKDFFDKQSRTFKTFGFLPLRKLPLLLTA